MSTYSHLYCHFDVFAMYTIDMQMYVICGISAHNTAIDMYCVHYALMAG